MKKNEREIERKKKLFIRILEEMQELKTNVMEQKRLEGTSNAEEWGTHLETGLMEMEGKNTNTRKGERKRKRMAKARWRKAATI